MSPPSLPEPPSFGAAGPPSLPEPPSFGAAGPPSLPEPPSFGPPSLPEPSSFGEPGLDFTRLAVIDLGRHFGRRNALAHITFDCHAGEIVGVLGPNGAGKSTLLSILATLLTPSTGRVEYGAVTARDAGAALRARLGLLGHDLYLYSELTARENLTFFARVYGLPKVAAAVDAGLEHAALTSRADDPIGGFSRGMRQRLALERALLHRPRLVLLDEPFTGLDQTSIGALVTRLKGLRDAGCLILLATHDLEIAEHVVTRSLFLRAGRLAPDPGPGGDLRARYQQAMVPPSPSADRRAGFGEAGS